MIYNIFWFSDLKSGFRNPIEAFLFPKTDSTLPLQMTVAYMYFFSVQHNMPFQKGPLRSYTQREHSFYPHRYVDEISGPRILHK